MKNNLPNSHRLTTAANDIHLKWFFDKRSAPRPVGVHLSTLDAKSGAKIQIKIQRDKKIAEKCHIRQCQTLLAGECK